MSGLKDALDAAAVANLVLMLRARHRGSFCLVEGGDDEKLFSGLLDTGACQVVVANGWEKVVGALVILESRQAPGVLAVIDSDLNRHEGNVNTSLNLFWSDFHDVEMDLFCSTAFDKVIVEHCGDRGRTATASGVRTQLLAAAKPLGYLRLLNQRRKLNLTFKGVALSHFIDRSTLAVDVKAMVVAVRNKSQRHDLGVEDIVEQLNSLPKPADDERLLCRGHDITEILSMCLRRLYDGSDASAAQIESAMRVAYSDEHFRQSALYGAILAWEARNAPYRVVRRTL